QRDLDLDLSATARLTADLQASLLQLSSLAHAEQSEVLVLVKIGLGAGDVETLAVILDHDRDTGGLKVDGDLGHLRPRVLVNVRQRFLDDAEEHPFGVARKTALLSDHIEAGREAVAVAVLL